MMAYATIADALRELRGDTVTDASIGQAEQQQMLISMLHRVSRVDNRFNSRGWQYFAPRLDTITIQILPHLVDSHVNRLQLPYPLLELASAKMNGADISPTLLPAGVSAGLRTPYWALYLPSTTSWYTADCGAGSSGAMGLNVEIAGVWGMVRNWGEALHAEDAVLNASGIDASEETITVADVGGPSYFYEFPRFSVGNLIKVDDEYMSVVDTDSTLNTLTVRRAQNGSIAAAHAVNAPVSVFYPDRSLREEFARQCAMWYQRIGAFNVTEVTEVGTTITFPPDLLAGLLNFLNDYVSEGV